jgi:AraC family transcriptional regulator
VYPSTQTELIVCSLDPEFIAEVAAEQESGFTHQLRGKMGIRDEAVGTLVHLLEDEAKSDGILGRLYVDHLSYALTIRLLCLGMKRKDGHTSKDKLSRPCLQRVVDRMEADLSTDLDLQTLAVESGYSRNHFLRMFRAATGYTPHQYLLHLRVKRAQMMMMNKSMQLIDVALACGFSTHAQLSRVFRQVIGTTPSEYRRNIL